jgi:type IV pilus assembly protein PilW
MADSSATLNVVNGDGFAAGDMILISQPGLPCSLMQASANAVQSAGFWTIDHATVGTTPFNPVVFPVGGYPVGAKVTNMGPGPCCVLPASPSPSVYRTYSVGGTTASSLLAEDVYLRTAAGPPPTPAPTPLVEGIISIRAQYGVDNNNDGFLDAFTSVAPATAAALVAVRIAVVARSGQYEKTAVSPAVLALWPGGTIANGGAINLSATATDYNSQNYRYKVFQTTIPLRNVIWTNN